MANDGKVVLGTEIDTSGAAGGLKKLAAMATAAVGALATYAIKVGMDFEAGMSEVAAISGATGDELAALTDKAKEMGIQTKFSATEASDALKYMAMAGWQTEDMLDGISGVMNLAAASGEDLGLVSDIVTDSMTAFGLSAKDSAHFADVLAMASNASNTNVAMLGETFKYVAPLAGTLEYSVEDMSVAIGLMANASIKGSQAGTSLRAILSRMSKPTKEVSDAMDALGINMYDANDKARPLNDVMVDLRSALDESRVATGELTDKQRTNYITAIAGQEAMSGLAAIVNASEADFNKLTAAVAGADGTAQKMADTMNDNLKGQITLLGSSCEGLGLAIYDGISEPLKEAAKWAIESVNDMTKSFQSGKLKSALQSVGKLIGDLVKAIMQIAKAVIPVLVKALALVGDNLNWLLPLVTGLVVAFKGLKIATDVRGWLLQKAAAITADTAATAANTVATTANTTATAALTVAKKALSSALSFVASPMGALTVGLGLLVGGLIAAATHTDEVIEEFRDLTTEVEANTQAWSESKAAMEDQLAVDLQTYDQQEKIVQKLREMTDEKGNISEKDLAWATVLAGDLNPELAELVGLNDDGTTSLKKNGEAVDELMAKQRAQIVIDAKLARSKEANIKLEEALRTQMDLTAKKRELEAQLKDAEVSRNGWRVFEIRAQLEELGIAYDTNEEAIKGYYKSIGDYEAAYTAFKNGEYDKVNAINIKTADSYKTMSNEAIQELQNQCVETKDKWDYLRKLYDQGADGVTKEMVDGAKAAHTQSQIELDKAVAAFGKAATDSADEWIAKMGKKKTAMTSIVANVFAAVSRAAQANLPSVKLSVPGSTSRYNKSGLEYVWEDNMPVRVHKGEAILTADEARVWRAQKGLATYDDVAAMYESAKNTVAAETSGISNRMGAAEQRRAAFSQPRGWDGGGVNLTQTLHNRTDTTIELDGDVLARKLDDRTRINRLRKGR